MFVAYSPTREGHQDRKLQLMARRPEKYNRKTEIDLNAKVNVNLTGIEIARLLDNSPQDIDFSELEEDN